MIFGRRFLSALSLIALLWACPLPLLAQEVRQEPSTPDAGLAAPARVEVNPATRDEEIERRLRKILVATGWFTAPEVKVTDGVAFLTGETERDGFKTWAGGMARNTQDVVAVVNRIEVRALPWWNFTPAVGGLSALGRKVVAAVPNAIFSFAILALAWIGGRVAGRGAHIWLRKRIASPLLCSVLARSVHLGLFLVGLYIVLQLAGLTNVAFTVVGGTGLLGLILGIAFREITENFLASIFLTLQQPFRTDDLVEISGTVGFVQRLTARATILMTPEGNHVQIPNAMVYKSLIRNYTSNPNRREDFVIGIGNDDIVTLAQAIARKVLDDHPAVLAEPEPWVLVDSLGKATVNLKVYFWLDGTKHSWLKVRSSVTRQVKRAFQNGGISMPDEAREVVFPNGVPIHMVSPTEPQADPPHTKPGAAAPPESATSNAEGGLASEAGEIEQQARAARTPEDGENLLGRAHGA